MRNLLFFFLVLVSAAKADAQALRMSIDSLVASSEFLHKSQLGLMVYDLDADSTLYAYNAEHTMRPASTLKLLTAITALDKYGDSYQFKTRLKWTGEVCDSTRTLNGDVILVGGMDPRLGHDDLVAFAESVKRLGVDTIRGCVCVDKSMKDTLMLGEGWCWDDDNPLLSPCLYDRKDRLADAFVEILNAQGIVVDGKISEQVAPPYAKEICSRSHSMEQILMRMMKNSDNLFAECVFYQLDKANDHVASAKGARMVVQALIKKIGRNASDYRLADGSGLSLYNYVSPDLEIAFLRYAYRNSNIYSPLYQSLPVAGIDGTLEKRMRNTPAENNVRAKTGTVTGVSSLAGYATTKDGRHLAFCIINQGSLEGAKARGFQDRVCELLCR